MPIGLAELRKTLKFVAFFDMEPDSFNTQIAFRGNLTADMIKDIQMLPQGKVHEIIGEAIIDALDKYKPCP